VTVYVEPVRADFWQLAKEPGSTRYLDPLGPKDCMTHSAARAVMRALEGQRPAGATGVWPPTGYEIRRHCIDPDTGGPDTTGGVRHSQIVAVVKRLYGVELTPFYGNSFDDLVDLVDETRGAMVSLWYKRIRDNASRRGSFTFFENHEFFANGVDRSRAVFTGTVDPLADGRQAGLFHGPGTYPFSLVKAAMGELNVSMKVGQYAALGAGKGYFLVTKPTGAAPSAPTGPIVTRFNVTITGYTPLYRAPGGARVKALTSASYRCGRTLVDGQWWYRIVARTDFTKAANALLYFRPNAHTKVVPA
jgi:hypothetical protein